jgi:integrase/recombinase XerD
MNLHANAALSLKGRRELCRAVVQRERTLTQAAEAAGVSVRCARKWVGRYRAEGEPGLRDRSSAPHRIPHRTSHSASRRSRRWLAGRRAGRPGRGGVRLVRTPRTLPRVLSPGEVDQLLGALRTWRDRAMVFAMLLGGLRRCEVLGLRLCDVSVGERRVHITCGKGGRERIVPVSGRFFAALGAYLELERSAEASTEACFVVLKGPRRGLPLSPSGLDEVLDGARARAGLARCTCHQLRHTCLTRLREQGMALEAVQAQAGHASIESTRIYLHLANDWLAREYLAAAEAIDAQLDPLAGELAS